MKRPLFIELLIDIRNAMMMQKKMFTIEELATYTGFEISYLYKLCSQKKIPYYKPSGGKLFFDSEEIYNWIKAHRVNPIWEIEEEAKSQLKSFQSKLLKH